MKKKILFIAPGYYGFNDVISSGLKTYTDHRIIDINSTLPYKYRHIGERIYNFFLKTFLRKNLKVIKRGMFIRETIIRHKQFDLLITNRPDVLSEEDFQLALKNSLRTVCVLWDSLEKVPEPGKRLQYFDSVYSFDPDDCRKFGFKSITNFYFKRSSTKNYNYDVALLITYDDRIQDVIRLFNYFEKKGIKAKGKIFTYKSHPIKEPLPAGLEVIHKIIPFDKAFEFYLDSKSILDIAHPHQKGLSFRPFEAIGLEKKLITTANIKHYDFYNPENVVALDDVDNICIPNSFFENPYHPIDENIAKQYFIENWIQKIIS